MEPVKLSRFQKAKLLVKGAFTTLKLDKELVTLPFMSAFFGLIVFVGFIVATVLNTVEKSGSTDGEFVTKNGILQAAFVVLMYLLVSVISRFFEAAIFAGAIKRFNGENPTVRSSIGAAKKRFKPLLVFSLFAATVGLVLQTIAEKLPLGGKIVAWLAGAAWSVANIFSVPVIMSTEEPVTPVQAVKGSVSVFRKVWGENVVADLGTGLIFFLVFVASLFGVGALLTLGAVIGLPTFVIGGLGIIGGIGIFTLAMVFAALGSIVKAALYYYATTGKSPEAFSSDLLKQAMTVKKSRKIFAGK